MVNRNNESHRLTPSEEFDLAHPDYVQSRASDREWDPNSRRAERQKGSGGGFAAAVSGELSLSQTLEAVASVDEGEITDPVIYETDTGEKPVYFEEPVLLDEETKARGLNNIAQIKADIAARRNQNDGKPKHTGLGRGPGS